MARLTNREMDIADTIACFRYYAGLADKLHGQSNNHFGHDKLVYTLHQPIGVCGQMSVPLILRATPQRRGAEYAVYPGTIQLRCGAGKSPLP
jgi:hypothetical protein